MTQRHLMRKDGLENLTFTGHTEGKTNRVIQRVAFKACPDGRQKCYKVKINEVKQKRLEAVVRCYRPHPGSTWHINERLILW